MSTISLRKSVLLGLGALLSSLCATAHAGVIMSVNQVGTNVVATASGTINLTALTQNGPSTGAAQVWPGLSSGSFLTIGPSTQVNLESYRIISGPTSFGTGNVDVLAGSGSGTMIGVLGNGTLFLAQSYVSGSSLSSTSTYNNNSIAGLGLAGGTYTWTWGSGATADSLTLDIASPTPEPGSIALAAAGLLGLYFRRRRA